MAKYVIESTTLTNIAEAIREKNGSTTEYKPSEMPAAISAIETGGGSSDGWQPQSDWWDIEKILEEDTEDYPAKMILLISNSYDEVKIPLCNASKFITSDGLEYTSATTHTWDTSKDKECSLGYKTRYIIWYYSSSDITTISDQIYPLAPLYIIHKNMNFSISDGNRFYYNSVTLECIKMVNSTRTDTKIRFNGSLTSLKKIIGFSAPNVTNVSSLFQNCSALDDANMQEIIESIDWSKVTVIESMCRTSVPISYLPYMDTSSVTDFSYAFDNAFALRVIENLDFTSATRGINNMFLSKGLISINKISNIKLSGMNLSNSIYLNHDTLIRVLNALYDYASEGSTSTYTLTLGATNLAKLTDEEKAIATNKGWTLN